ncbi:putative GMC oxidoreductase [Daldinia eschscholtzii]|nr:putative GMC oxidoreductase [Daldinia eschscholtzii]
MPTTKYDFIVIGGGTAGLVVATRLSEDPNQRVLVLEAGGDLSKDPRVNTPALGPTLFGTDADWSFETEPQAGLTSCKANLNGRLLNIRQGKALGGSSAINAQVFVPPTNESLDTWETLGNEGWNSDTLLKYYAKTFTSPTVDESQRDILGIDGYALDKTSNGPLQLSYAGNQDHPIRKAWAEMFRSKGYDVSKDPFLGISAGAFSSLSSIDPTRKERSYATSAYYNPIKDRANLEILTNTTVEKVLFEASHYTKATGVQYRQKDHTEVVTASKEVILAAGAFQSPKLLELSGIGDKLLLERYSIEPIKDLPGVGENLHDHLACGIAQEPEVLEKAMKDCTIERKGLLTSMGVNTYAYLPLVESLSEPDRETIKKLLAQHRPSGNLPHEIRAGTYYELVEKMLLNPKEPSGAYLSVLGQQTPPVDPASDSPSGPVPGSFITIGAMLSQPISRGSVHIGSDNPFAAPIINPNYYSNEIDIEVHARHMLYLDVIAKSPPFSNLLKQPLVRRDPASNLTDVETAKRYLRTSVTSMEHFGGTCAMLPEEKGGVVNAKLKVYGVDNLRVVDASAIPLNSFANLQSTVYAFAERAADLIKQDYGLCSL